MQKRYSLKRGHWHLSWINVQLPYQNSDNACACELDWILSVHLEAKMTSINAHQLINENRYKYQ